MKLTLSEKMELERLFEEVEYQMSKATSYAPIDGVNDLINALDSVSSYLKILEAKRNDKTQT